MQHCNIICFFVCLFVFYNFEQFVTVFLQDVYTRDSHRWYTLSCLRFFCFFFPATYLVWCLQVWLHTHILCQDRWWWYKYAMIRGGGGYVRIGVVNADNARMECFMHVHKSCSRLGFGCGASKRGLDPHLHWLILYNSAETNIDNEFEILELCLSPLWVAAKTLCYYWCCIVSSLRSEVKYIVGCGLVVWVC